MPTNNMPQAKLTTVATFPTNYFLENLVVRSDNSVLITVLNHKELWYVPPSRDDSKVEPLLLFTFSQLAMGIVEAEPNVFYISTSDIYTSHESYLHRLDLSDWVPGVGASPETILRFPEPVRALNGSCAIAPSVILLADCFSSLIWRVDLNTGNGKPTARVWLKHDSMGYFPGQMKPEQPGVNGIRYAAKLGYLYYTVTAKQLFMRVKVNAETLDPIDEPEHVSMGRMADDFCIDESAGVGYLTTHRENTIECVSLDPAKNSNRFIVAGDPLNEELIGPSSAAWGRLPEEYGKVAFVTTDGGAASPLPDGVRRPARLLRVEFPEAPAALRSL
jgi:hypothetical protein